jgi:hypothetical protein
VLANATSYGIAAEFIRREDPKPVACTVYADTPPHELRIADPDMSGEYCFPPLAACITGAARLMLALLETQVTQRLGGSYVFCDTDSMAIVATPDGGLEACPGGPHHLPDGREAVRALSWEQVDEIIERFASLNPYDPGAVPGSILKIEAENYDPDHRQRQQLWCLAISAKRYALYNPTGDQPTLRKWSEHGLGHLLNPTDPDGDQQWIRAAWQWILATELGQHPDDPPWFDRPALSRTTVSTPQVERWFAQFNATRPWEQQVKPFSFMVVAQPDPLGGHQAKPIAPYETRADKWDDLNWIDRSTGSPVSITTALPDGTISDHVRVRTYRDHLAEYRAHAEAKSLAPDGEPVRRRTRGLLRRRPVEGVVPVLHIGKEGNRIDDRAAGLVDRVDEYQTVYPHTRAEWDQLWLPALRTIGPNLIAKWSGAHRRTIVLSGTTPHQRLAQSLQRIAVDHARHELTHSDAPVPRDDRAITYHYLASLTPPACRNCTKPLTGRQRQWCSDRCRNLFKGDQR